MNSKKKDAVFECEIMADGPNGELIIMVDRVTPQKLEEIKEQAKNTVITHNIQKQLSRWREKND